MAANMGIVMVDFRCQSRARTYAILTDLNLTVSQFLYRGQLRGLGCVSTTSKTLQLAQLPLTPGGYPMLVVGCFCLPPWSTHQVTI
jgi:hypothetical protein